MIELINLIIGSGIIILTLIPFILKKYDLLLLTSIIAFIMTVLLAGI